MPAGSSTRHQAKGDTGPGRAKPRVERRLATSRSSESASPGPRSRGAGCLVSSAGRHLAHAWGHQRPGCGGPGSSGRASLDTGPPGSPPLRNASHPPAPSPVLASATSCRFRGLRRAHLQGHNPSHRGWRGRSSRGARAPGLQAPTDASTAHKGQGWVQPAQPGEES